MRTLISRLLKIIFILCLAGYVFTLFYKPPLPNPDIIKDEIKNIEPPNSVKDALEKQMRAEREKRAAIAESEGQRQAITNVAEGDKQEAIKKSEGEKMKRINN